MVLFAVLTDATGLTLESQHLVVVHKVSEEKVKQVRTQVGEKEVVGEGGGFLCWCMLVSNIKRCVATLLLFCCALGHVHAALLLLIRWALGGAPAAAFHGALLFNGRRAGHRRCGR
jgi:hypothetical protein